MGAHAFGLRLWRCRNAVPVVQRSGGALVRERLLSSVRPANWREKARIGAAVGYKRAQIKPKSRSEIITICSVCRRSYDPMDEEQAARHKTRRH